MVIRNSILYRLIVLVIAVSASVVAMSQTIVDTRTKACDAFIRSVQTRVGGVEMAVPVIPIDAPEGAIEICFDELADEYRQLRYEIIHCNSDWQPTKLLTATEYASDFNLADIDNYAYSQPGLSSRYVHYSIPFPNARLRPLVSGNYLLRVFPYDDPDKTLLQSRFMVSEQSAAVVADVNTVTDIDFNESHQQLKLRVNVEHATPEVVDPFSRLKVVVYQNMRTDNAAVIPHPSRVEGRGQAVYEHLMPMIFKGGNEYRRFETVSTTYTPMHIETMQYHYPYYHAWLETDEPRATQPYSYDETQAGRYRVRNANGDDSDTEAEYMVTHFTLSMPKLSDGREVVIDGDLTYHGADPAAVMTYDEELKAYTRALLLKQGSYNYQYLVRDSSSTAAQMSNAVEGNFHETGNEYVICVYYSAPGERYERLLSCAMVSMR